MSRSKQQEERREFILDYIREHGSTDVTDSDFHDAFANEFKVRQIPKMYGACPYPAAIRLLRKMHKEFLLVRSVVGLDGMGGIGFPTWVYVYRLPSLE